MKKLALFVLMAGLSTVALADQKATITCIGSKVILTEKAPYFGENSKYSQSLFILKAKSVGAQESRDTAYFLNVDLEGDVDSNYMIWSVGKNEKGGKFTLKTHFWEDVGDGTVIKKETTGVLTYNHGPLKGTNEQVKCVKE